MTVDGGGFRLQWKTLLINANIMALYGFNLTVSVVMVNGRLYNGAFEAAGR